MNTNESAGQIKSSRPRFWAHQFPPEATSSQLAFDVLFGVVGPVLCFIFDPIVFRSGGVWGKPLLADYQLVAYLFSALKSQCWFLYDNPHEASVAARRLRSISFLSGSKLDKLVDEYRKSRTPTRKERLATSYRDVTGEDIERKVAILMD